MNALGQAITCGYQPEANHSNDECPKRESECPSSRIVYAACELTIWSQLAFSQDAFSLIPLHIIQGARVKSSLKLISAPPS